VSDQSHSEVENLKNIGTLFVTEYCAECNTVRQRYVILAFNYVAPCGVCKLYAKPTFFGSTTSNLLEMLNDLTLALNNSKSVCIAFVDFAKALDSVCNSKLLCKLQSYGISGQLIKWISNFLSNRSQQTFACNLYADDLKLYTVLHANEDCGYWLRTR